VLTIRLSRIGKKKKPFYRVVVIERTRPRDGRVKEAVGTYDPLKKPAEIKLDAERIKYWMGLGAQPFPGARMKDLVEAIARALVDHPEDVQVKSVEGSQVTVLELRVHPEDLGKVIGRQGRTAKAIRTLLGASGMKLHKRFTLEILED
jgi:ribosomal protein S16